MSGYDYSQDVANEMLEECHAENTKLEAENAALRAELAAKQAKIDSLMLEFCPEEMTPEQMEEWARNQRPYAGDVVMVPREILDRFQELNPNNYDHDDVCNLNAWAVELVLAAAPDQLKIEPVTQTPNYTPGEWVECRSIDEMQAFFMSRLDAIRQAARGCGYAIGLHGSCRRDFDLMAMQWRDDCTDPDTLAKAIQDAACGIHADKITWEKKPNGRIATSLCICWTDHSEQFNGMLSVGHIDLSLIAAATGVAQTGNVGVVPNWQPIETAPKDGTTVLTVWDGSVREAWCAGAGKSRDGGDWWASHSLRVSKAARPTHWIPLPAAPGVQAGEKDNAGGNSAAEGSPA